MTAGSAPNHPAPEKDRPQGETASAPDSSPPVGQQPAPGRIITFADIARPRESTATTNVRAAIGAADRLSRRRLPAARFAFPSPAAQAARALQPFLEVQKAVHVRGRLDETVRAAQVSTLAAVAGASAKLFPSLTAHPAENLVRSVVQPFLTQMLTVRSPLDGLTESLRTRNVLQNILVQPQPADLMAPLRTYHAQLDATINSALDRLVKSTTLPMQEALRNVLNMPSPLAQVLKTNPFASLLSMAEWAARTSQSVFNEFWTAYEAYASGDPALLKEFVYRRLYLRPVLDDHCQALALAMCEENWGTEIDVMDDREIVRVLAKHAKMGADRDIHHQIRHQSIVYLPDGWQPTETALPLEELVISRATPWVQQFDTAPAQFVVKTLNEQDQAVVRAFIESPGMTWPQATAVAEQELAAGERNRRKLRRGQS